jgi:hypothetical protein
MPRVILLALDCSRVDTLAVCTDPGCCFRAGPFTNYDDARGAADRHRRAMHVKAAADAAYARRRRARLRDEGPSL